MAVSGVTGQEGPGDDWSSMDDESNGLGMGNGSSVDSGWGSMNRSGSNDRRGGDRAETMAEDKAGGTTGSGGGDSQDGSEDSLKKIVRWV